MILRDVLVPGKELQCDKCKLIWVSISRKLPSNCPNRDCRAREWNGKKKRKPRIQLPKPKRMHSTDSDEEMGF